MKVKIETYKKIIERMINMAKNPWIPAPLYSMAEEEEQVEKNNDDIPLNSLTVHIGNLTSENQSVYLQMVIPYSNDKMINELINKRPETTDFAYDNNFKFEKNEFKHLYRKAIVLTLVESSGCFCFKKETRNKQCTIKLDNLKERITIEGEYEFKYVHNQEQGEELEQDAERPKAINEKIKVTVKVNTPALQKEFTTVSKLSLKITKTFPSFKGDDTEPVIDNEQKHTKINEIKPKEKIVEKKQIIVQPQSEKKENQNQKELIIDPKEFTQDELDDPDNVEKMISLKVLEFKIKKLEEKISKIEGRAPPKLRERLLKMRVKYKVINNINNNRLLKES